MWEHPWLKGVVSVLFCVGLAHGARDITRPGDTVIGVPNDWDWPLAETPPLAIDDNVYTKYLHFKGDFFPNVGPTGFRVSPSVGAVVVTGLTFTTANDVPGRDPTAFELSGSNVGIYGPYTLIAAGPISDFAGIAPWPRYTKTVHPIILDNDVAYAHYQILFTSIRGPVGGEVNSMQIAEVELLGGVDKATAPNPPNGAIGVINPVLTWTRADTAVLHNVYFATQSNLTVADRKSFRTPGAVYYHESGFQPGVTYYWRVDSIAADGTVETGDLWHFTARVKTAYDPDPADRSAGVGLFPQLTWQPGWGATRHRVFFGESFADVDSGTAGTDKGDTTWPHYAPGQLDTSTQYYWRVDEFDGSQHYRGDVWSFTTQGLGGGLHGEYYNDRNLDQLVLTRLDPEINFWWDLGSPDPSVNADLFSVRWRGEVEIPRSEPYTFITRSDDGVRLYVNNRMVIDNWTDHSWTDDRSDPIPLVAGQRYPIRMEFYESWGHAGAVLEWQSPSMLRQVIPSALLSPPYRAQNPRPANMTDVPFGEAVVFYWASGDKAVRHDVYFGDVEEWVRDADVTDQTGIYRGRQIGNIYAPPDALEQGVTYYWRIDELNDDGTVTVGNVWQFTVADYVMIEDFEGYAGTVDTFEDNIGIAPSAERTVVHQGTQSMRFDYRNLYYPYFSRVERTWDGWQNWTRGNPTTLTLWVCGQASNNPENVSVELKDSSWSRVRIEHDDPFVITLEEWQRWDIDLVGFTSRGTNLEKIISLSIVVGDPLNTGGSSGKLFIDDIRLTNLTQ
jgi:hypothetical protein